MAASPRPAPGCRWGDLDSTCDEHPVRRPPLPRFRDARCPRAGADAGRSHASRAPGPPRRGGTARGPQPAAARGRRALRRAAARRGRRGLGQDPGADPPHRLPDQRARRPALADPRDHLHQQGRGGDEAPGGRGRRCRRPARGRHVPLGLPAHHPAPPRSAVRVHVELRGVRRHRLATPDAPRAPRPRPRREAVHPPRGRERGQRAEERADRPRDLRVDGGRPAAEGVRRLLRALPASPARSERDGLRRHHHGVGQPAAGVPGRGRALPAPVPPRSRRRVPGHEPRAVHADPRADRHPWRDCGPAAGRAVRRRRRRPVDLRVPRRHDPQHRGVRARLPGRGGDHARAELPLDADDPVGSQRRDRAQPEPQAQESLVGRGGRRADRRLGRAGRARRGVLRRGGGRPPARRGRGEARRGRGVLPDERGLARVRRGVHPGRHALQDRGRHAVLRAPRDPRRDGVPAGAVEPGRPGLAAAHPQRPEAGDRRPRGGLRGRAGDPRAHLLPRGAAPVRGGLRAGDAVAERAALRSTS